MSAPMKKRHTKTATNKIIVMFHSGQAYKFPESVAKKYKAKEKIVSPDVVFADLYEEYGKVGTIIRGFRGRENMTQVQLAKKLDVTQSDISQIENGKRNVGRKIAKKLGVVFNTDYRNFLA